MGNYWSTSQESSNKTRKYGWRRDLPDRRDLYHQFNPSCRVDRRVDHRSNCPDIYNQGHLGSCTANAIAAAYQFDQLRQGEGTQSFVPSRLFIYYNEREKEGNIETDSGAEIRDGIKSIHCQGVCPEPQWPYNIDKFTTKPTEACYQTATHHTSVHYRRVSQNLKHIKACLSKGLPIVFGFTVFTSFELREIEETGIMSMPKQDEKPLGGHAVMAVGYDDRHQWIIVRNSWGSDWGDGGYFYMPYRYICDEGLCSDFWTVQTINDSPTTEKLKQD
jgi:C1A family cysteine protease